MLLTRRLRLFVCAIAAVCLFSVPARAEVDYGGYRPSYQGYGVNTPGGRGGTVQRVTHLMDTTDTSSPYWNGSLRKAVTTPGARFVIFEVSGYISLVASPLVITQPYLTIAGQTAPSPGITIRNGYLEIDTHDVVIQHIRVRPGALGNLPHGIHVRNGANNIVLDHVSVSWTVWTAIDLHGQDAPAPNIGDVTLIDSLVSEVLACSGVNWAIPCDPTTMTGTPHSRAILAGDNNTSTTYNNGRIRFSMIRTISADNDQRHPEIQGDVDTFIVNNLIYNPSLTPIAAMAFDNEYQRGPARAVVVGNYLVPGPTTPGYNGYVPHFYPEAGDLYMMRIHDGIDAASQIYLDGNYYVKFCGGTTCLATPSAQWSLALDGSWYVGKNVRASSPPVSLANLPLSSVMPYTQVESYLTANAGARPLDRDPVDTRVINDVRNRTGHDINNPADVGGYPVLAVNTRSLTVPADPNAVIDSVGRTRIEAWLESFARALEPAHQSTLSAPANLHPVQ